MSTNIRVDVDSDGLRKRLREQQQAQRLAYLEKGRQQGVEEDALNAKATRNQQLIRQFPPPLTKETINRRGYRPDDLSAFRAGKCPPVYDRMPGGAWVRPAGFIHADSEGYTQLRIDTPDDFTVIKPGLSGECTLDNSALYLQSWPRYYPDLAGRDPLVNPPTGAWIFIGRIKYFSVKLIKEDYGNEFFERCGDAIWRHEITREVQASKGQEPPVLETVSYSLLLMDSSASNQDGITRMAPPLYTFSTTDGSPGVVAKCYFINGVAQYS